MATRPAASKANRQATRPAAAAAPAERSLSRGLDAYIEPYLDRPCNLILEIGSFRGATTNLLCERYLAEGGKVIAVDPLLDGVYVPIAEDSPEELRRVHRDSWQSGFSKQYEFFVANTKRNEARIELVRKTSADAYPDLLARYEGQVDLIYVDGDHRAAAVWEDAIHAFRLCRVGGLIIFDDYLWRKGEFAPELTPLPAVDRFLAEYGATPTGSRVRVRALKIGYRVTVRKEAE